MYTKRKSSGVNAKAIAATVCVTFILIVIAYLLFGRKKKTEVKDLNTVKSEIKDKKKQLKDRKTLLDEMKSLKATDLSEVEKLEKELTSKLTLATKQLTEKETLLKTQQSKFLATESKLKTELSNKSWEVSNLKAQLSKLIEETSSKGSEKITNAKSQDYIVDSSPTMIESNLEEVSDDNLIENPVENDVINSNITNDIVDADRTESTTPQEQEEDNQDMAIENDIVRQISVNEDDYAPISPVVLPSKESVEENFEKTLANMDDDPEEKLSGEENVGTISSNSSKISKSSTEGTDYEKAWRNMDNDPE